MGRPLKMSKCQDRTHNEICLESRKLTTRYEIHEMGITYWKAGTYKSASAKDVMLELFEAVLMKLFSFHQYKTGLVSIIFHYDNASKRHQCFLQAYHVMGNIK